MPTRLESKTAKGVALWIDQDAQGLHRLDCAWSGRGKHFDELPRFYRTERGAKQGAALLTGERLTWVQPSPGTTN
ncbi:hypothetical protein ACR3H8_33440 [Pseudomonas aeruginosa]|uniref:hypothetical protein n=1 Tax=Pseudomonas aeruginosa group TaxID=136841 RepID=UPI0003BB2F97|nr:hypothetical protein [Pseudomonas aeruginosa]EIU2716241.1 hypothetical protein [Pseudomonas aeruginosa]EIU2863060.1 hypothetical protein [Pseudomonas aeruginosa]ELD5772970.1 hypothetical protein [Pseudomonas aeruginosa]ERW60451.1 hypothetical protein Q024_06571 [Pseudomonas aeruginosa BWHPSA011]ETV28682.1 hypothetical protein Q046_05599 [Pseudomonas aeruginosa BWHPSA041]